MMTFQPWLDQWDLTADGAPFETLTSTLMPVRRNGDAGMLKLTTSKEELAGGALMVWWAGEGAAAVWAREGEALLMARATGSGSLASMARDGRDDEACRVLCTAAARLHAKRPNPPPNTLVPLTRWFEALWPTAQTHGGLFAQSAKAARDLLDNPQDPTVLHGDLHHDNVLDFADRGWLAIDPKGLIAVEAGGYQPLLGKSYPEIAAASRTMHKSQGFGVGVERGENTEYFKFLEGKAVENGNLFAGIDTTWSRVPNAGEIAALGY